MFDTECFISKASELMKAKLNDELALIDTEKGDYIIDKINPNAWPFQNLNDEVFSYSNFCIWGLYDQPKQTDTLNNNSIKEIKLFFEVVTTDDGGPINENVFYRMLRYQRALESVAHKNFNKIWSGVKIKVDSLTPSSFDLDGKTFRTSGILISAALTAN